MVVNHGATEKKIIAPTVNYALQTYLHVLLDGARKLEGGEEIHTGEGRACRLTKKRQQLNFKPEITN